VRWVKFISSHASFIAKSNSVNCIKIRLIFEFDEVTDKNKLAPFYGSRHCILIGLYRLSTLLHLFSCIALLLFLWSPNSAGHYILQLWFLSFFFLRRSSSSFFPGLFSAVADLMLPRMTHMSKITAQQLLVWPTVAEKQTRMETVNLKKTITKVVSDK